MKDQTQDRWFQLALLARAQQDPDKVLALTSEIDRLLAEEQKRRKKNRTVTQARKSEDIRSAV